MINFLGFQLNGWFLAAGAACATAPIIIHLLNRRRFRTVQWAAMDFLRQALQRNRRIMRLRDLLLMALRTLAVLLFGLALAQPLWREEAGEASDPADRKPLHAVMIVDNSLSMGYEGAAQESSLDRAKKRAKQFINDLPSGSRVTVVPLCGAQDSYSLDPYRTVEEATGAVDQIEVVHRGTNIDQAADVARRAVGTETNLDKRVVYLSDQQRTNWQGRLQADALQQYPAMQIVDVSATGAAGQPAENSWVSDFRLDDGIADTQTPAHFTVRLRHSGTTRRENVRLSLWVDGTEVISRSVDLEPGTAEQEFVLEHRFDSINIASGDTEYVPAKVSITADANDRLLTDNQRYLMVPVVAALPVVFVDELGARDENRALNRYGETWQLRRWLVPILDRNTVARQLVRIVHVSIDELNEELLSEARLVVVAGVKDPSAQVDLLREYVQQGGQLLIAAGGDFDPQAWNTAAWLEGGGILPAPLEPELIGQIPGVGGADFQWFELAYDGTLKSHGLFKLSDESDADLAALYSQPFFFQAVHVRDVEAVAPALIERETERLAEQFASLAAAKAGIDRYNELEADGALTEEQRAQRSADQELLRTLRPRWLKWAGPDAMVEKLKELADAPVMLREFARQEARRQRPQVLARFDNGHPFLVERSLGRGRVMFASSGIKPEWNTLTRTDAVLLYDRVLRGMLNATLPRRNFVTQESISLPVQGNTSSLEFELQRPEVSGAAPEPAPLTVSFIGAQTRGLTIHNPLHQGIYKIAGYERPQSADPQAERELKWETALAVNVSEGDEGNESELTPLTEDEFEERLSGADIPLTWVSQSENISLDGATIRGQNLWKILAAVVLMLLLVEIAILAWPVAAANAAQSEGSSVGNSAASVRTGSMPARS